MLSAMKRREFLMAGGAAALMPKSAAGSAVPRWKTSIFSKHLHFLQGGAVGEAAKAIGFDGVDITVRKAGHVEPERVIQDLPALVKAIRKHGVEVPMITSGIVDADTPHAENVLKTIAGLGIRYYRWGGFRYSPDGPILAQLESLKPRVAKLEKLNARYKVCAMYHTHSGIGQVGASIWDLHLLLKDFDPDLVSINYDTAHATIEGGFGGWINSFRVSEPHLSGIAVKDFLWAKTERGEWRPRWCPIGEGMVRFQEFFRMLAGMRFAGPIQLHLEYPLGGADRGLAEITIPREQVYAAMKRDLDKLHRWMREAGSA
jgi:sugar phosphate isomerase/epimerase